MKTILRWLGMVPKSQHDMEVCVLNHQINQLKKELERERGLKTTYKILAGRGCS